MAFITPNTPNLTDFTTFVYNQGVPQADLPSNSEYLTWAFNYADAVTLEPPATMAPILGVIAVYNLGMHHLLMIAQDQTGYTFFTDARNTYKLLSFSTGPIIASADQSTSESLLAPEWMKEATLATIGLLKTPWGRAYLEYAQAYGPTVVGVS